MVTTRSDEMMNPVTFEFPAIREKVNLMIHEGLTDMWLLLTGEEIEAGFRCADGRDGRAIAFLSHGQVHMLTSKPCALETLRVLGIELY